MKIIIISAVWCPSCLIMRPRFEEIAKKYKHLDFSMYDIDLDEEASAYSVEHVLPVFILLDQNNNEVERITGERQTEDLSYVIDKYNRIEE